METVAAASFCSMKVIPSIAFNEFSGSAGDVTARSVKGRTLLNHKAYQPKTGIAGYTLIYNSHGMRIMSHQPFATTKKAILENEDIQSHSDVFETEVARVMVMDTDYGNKLSNTIYDLTLLLTAYRQGDLTPKAAKHALVTLHYPEDDMDLMREWLSE